MAAHLHRVTWASTWTGKVNHHDPEEQAEAHAHLAFLRSRHPIVNYWLSPYTRPAGTTSEPRGDQVSPPPAALPVTGESGQDSGSVSMAAVRGADLTS